MAPLPENNTARTFTDYTVQGRQHTLLCRWDPAAGIETARFHIGEFLTALAPIMDNGWAITGARVSGQGSAFTVPTPPPVLGAAPAGGTLPLVNAPQFTSFIGRGLLTGRRVRVFVYGLIITVDSDYRLAGTLPAPIANAIAALEVAADDGVFCTIGLDRANWYDYANQGFNSYWEREARQS